MQDDSRYRNPPQVVRAMLVGGVLAMPGAIAGLILGLFLPVGMIPFAAGAVVGAIAGFLIELH